LVEAGTRLLYHLWLSAPCRKVRVVLAEKGLNFTLRVEKTWELRPEFLALNPTGEVPVLVEPDGAAIADSTAICEYLDEAYRDAQRPLLGSSPALRAEVRRLIAWFDRKFDREVTGHLVEQKIMKRFLGLGEPDSAAIRAGKANIKTHLDYVGYLTDRRKWLAGDEFTLADITAAAHFSTIDYLGDVAWEDYPVAKDWYARIKSRRSFRAILADSIPGAPPPKHYADLDF